MTSEDREVDVFITSIDRKQNCQIEDVFCTVSITSNVLVEWQRSLNDGKSTSFVSQLNTSMNRKVVQVNEERAERLEGRLRRKAGEIRSQLRKRNTNRTSILQKKVSFTVKDDEVLSADSIEAKYRYNNNT